MKVALRNVEVYKLQQKPAWLVFFYNCEIVVKEAWRNIEEVKEAMRKVKEAKE